MTPDGTVTTLLVVEVAPTFVIGPGSGVKVGDGTGVGLVFTALSASAMVSHPPLFIVPTSLESEVGAPSILSAAAEPKYEPLTYCWRTRLVRSPGIPRPVFSVA